MDRSILPQVTTRPFAFGAAVLVLAISVAIAVVGVSAGPLSCPVDEVAVRNAGYMLCERYVNPTDAPSYVEHVEATRDRKMVERLLIVGVGALGTLLLVALGLRVTVTSSETRAVP
jgi:hypothetical protein